MTAGRAVTASSSLAICERVRGGLTMGCPLAGEHDQIEIDGGHMRAKKERPVVIQTIVDDIEETVCTA